MFMENRRQGRRTTLGGYSKHCMANLIYRGFLWGNEILFAGEKEGGPARAHGCMDAFQKTLEHCELEDLRYVGDPFTWWNNLRDVEGYTRETLDRAVVSVSWRVLFPLHKIVNGDPGHSDHMPLIAKVNAQNMANGAKGRQKCFCFESRWLQEEGCEQVVEEAWDATFLEAVCLVGEAVRKVGDYLAKWDSEVLGGLKRRIKNVKRDLERCRRASIHQRNVSRELLLRYKVSRFEDQNNLNWQHRAHVNWLKYGDRNTKFFHIQASERRRINTIKKMRRENGGIVEREEELGPFITNYYKSLFISSAGPINDDILRCVLQFVTLEMRKALDSIGDLKAPRPDGMPTVFYKKIWSKMGPEIHEEVLKVLNGSEMPPCWKEITIVLIPKVKNPRVPNSISSDQPL